MHLSHQKSVPGLLFGLILSIAPLCGAQESTIFFRQGQPVDVDGTATGEDYTGTHDAQLREKDESSNFNAGSGGSDASFTVDADDPLFSGRQSHVVLRFDQLFGGKKGQIPPGSKIHSATLFIDIDNTGDNLALYQIAGTAKWSESTVTWRNFGSGGGVRIGIDTTGNPIRVSGEGDRTNIDVKEIVTAWSKGGANRGFAFLPYDGDGVDFNTSENSTIGDRPSLMVKFTPYNPLAPVFSTELITGAPASASHSYTGGSIARFVTDPDGDSPAFSKSDGPDWLTVSPDGTLSGVPGAGDMGVSKFRISAADDDGYATTSLQITVSDPTGNPPPPPSRTGKYRLVWASNPTTTMTIGWDQVSGSPGTVHFGTTDQGRLSQNYPRSQAVNRRVPYRGMNNCFVRLSGLAPDTPYYFVIRDTHGVSERFWFRTAPAAEKPFTFVAGGDSRNNRAPRLRANRMVSKLRPLFVAFTGDMINTDSRDEWRTWLDDWQESITSDGRIIPLLPHRGNHETGGNATLSSLFDIPVDNYYALSFGGSLLRYYVLNSETVEAGSQATWLASDLAARGTSHTHLVAGYHKPMRPHTSSKSEGSDEYDAWARIFFRYGVDLAIESDSHTMKRTVPIEPSTGRGSDEGFVRNDKKGTIYIGEGCWGAPLRSPNDRKSWTLASGSFNGFDLVHVHPDRMENYSVQVDNEARVVALREGEQMYLPRGAQLWNPPTGAMLMIGNVPSRVRRSVAAWQAETFGDTIPAGAGPNDNFDNDDLSNIEELALGRDPAKFDNDPVLTVRHASTPTFGQAGATGYFSLFAQP